MRIKKTLTVGVAMVSLFFGVQTIGFEPVRAAEKFSANNPPAISSADKLNTPTVAQRDGLKGRAGKAPAGSPTARLGGPYYFYAAGQQQPAVPPTDSISAAMNVGNPWVSAYDWHTLTEMAWQNTSGTNNVELGVTRDLTTFGDTKPRIFAYSWINGVGQGYNTNFVNYSGRTYTVGDDLTADVGTEQLFGISQTATAYWLSYKNTWLGYYLKTNWSGYSPSQTPPNGGKLQFFGEVAAGSTTPCTDMGGAPAPLATSTVGTRIASVTYTGTPTPTTENLSMFTSNSAWYNAALIGSSTRSLRYGGPGSC
jgi:hypothetical protein